MTDEDMIVYVTLPKKIFRALFMSDTFISYYKLKAKQQTGLSNPQIFQKYHSTKR